MLVQSMFFVIAPLVTKLNIIIPIFIKFVKNTDNCKISLQFFTKTGIKKALWYR